MRQAVVDLDGTLSDNRHRKHLIDGEEKKWREYVQKCVEDPLIGSVAEFVHDLAEEYDIVIITARSDEVKEETIEWLQENNIPFERLIMLPEGEWDWLDYKFKEEQLEKLENPVIAIDDKEMNCKMFERNGLETYIVEHQEPKKFS